MDRGLAETRSQAQALVLAGRVRVGSGDGARTNRKAGEPVPVEVPLEVVAPLAYVSRGGDKLAGALDAFGVDPAGRTCLDVGASTGGFTDCLLQRGAARVHAVDVGRGQLAAKLVADPRVAVHDRVNARILEPGMVAGWAGAGAAIRSAAAEDVPAGGPPAGRAATSEAAEDVPAGPEGAADKVDLAVIDVSFISLALVLGPVASCLAPTADVVALIKPQFEAGRASVRGGVVRDPAVHRSVLAAAVAHARAAGLRPIGLCASRLLGPAGNREFFLHAVRDVVSEATERIPSAGDLEARIAVLAPG